MGAGEGGAKARAEAEARAERWRRRRWSRRFATPKESAKRKPAALTEATACPELSKGKLRRHLRKGRLSQLKKDQRDEEAKARDEARKACAAADIGCTPTARALVEAVLPLGRRLATGISTRVEKSVRGRQRDRWTGVCVSWATTFYQHNHAAFPKFRPFPSFTGRGRSSASPKNTDPSTQCMSAKPATTDFCACGQ